jgi:hypothetical protein
MLPSETRLEQESTSVAGDQCPSAVYFLCLDVDNASIARKFMLFNPVDTGLFCG